MLNPCLAHCYFTVIEETFPHVNGRNVAIYTDLEQSHWWPTFRQKYIAQEDQLPMLGVAQIGVAHVCLGLANMGSRSTYRTFPRI